MSSVHGAKNQKKQLEETIHLDPLTKEW